MLLSGKRLSSETEKAVSCADTRVLGLRTVLELKFFSTEAEQSQQQKPCSSSRPLHRPEILLTDEGSTPPSGPEEESLRALPTVG